jgi:membrane protease YdiL (CAAX protease family)
MIKPEYNDSDRWGPFSTLFIAGLAILVGIVVNTILLQQWPDLTKGQAFVVGGSLLLAMLLVIPVAALHPSKPGLQGYFALRVPTFRQGLVGAAVFIGYVACLDLVFRALDRQAGMEAMQKVWLDCPPGTLWQAGFVFNVLVLAPFCEEVLFRGFLLEGLRTPFANRTEGKWLQLHWGEWMAVFISTGLWTALHGQYELPELMALLFMGVILGAVRLRTNSLYMAIALHFLNNLVALILLVNG